jgi:exopolyphosphatase/guanosine-5'-triphosphate,3'-diphosphate pyrophosphatase
MIDGNRYAVIDIGSNSVRLVVFGGEMRAPSVLFNEKVMAGLGRTKAAGDGLDPVAMERTLVALARFQKLSVMLGVDQPHTVATAAVRDAANGQAFLNQIEQLGLRVTLLSGEEEAKAAAYGVIAGFNNADGVVGDLGGGSLELARVKNGEVLQRASFPLGVLRLPEIRAQGPKALDRHVAKTLKAGGWVGAASGLPFYLVGGSWRALAKIHTHLTHHPLPILHHYIMPPDAGLRIARAVARFNKTTGKFDGIVSGARRPAMADAAAMLVACVNGLKPASLVVSTTGVREGLVYCQLPPEQQRRDPLIVAARVEARRQGRFSEHGDVLHRWLMPLFEGEGEGDIRLRRAACLLGDIGWAANPDFRAERALEFALHGNWFGVDARGRAMIAQALFSAFGGGGARPTMLEKLAPVADLDRARCWGLGIRVAQRLSGGAAIPLEKSRLVVSGGTVNLDIDCEVSALGGGEAVQRRLRQLATTMSLMSSIRITQSD